MTLDPTHRGKGKDVSSPRCGSYGNTIGDWGEGVIKALPYCSEGVRPYHYICVLVGATSKGHNIKDHALVRWSSDMLKGLGDVG